MTLPSDSRVTLIDVYDICQQLGEQLPQDFRPHITDFFDGRRWISSQDVLASLGPKFSKKCAKCKNAR